MADVFLSYKREDAAKVRKLVAALRKAGLDTWWDEDIAPSAPWEATIEKELARAKAVIVCWSPDAVASDNVRSEARVAREDGRLIQVFLKPCEPPLFFGERQGLDLSKWRGNADDPRIAKLAESARKVAAGERMEGSERAEPRRRLLDRRVHVALAVLLVLAGSLAGWWLLAPAKAEGPQTLAVLPFRALNPGDTNLVDAIWDDTRGAISKNPNLRVLGREAVTALAKRDLTPAEYRKKVGADYLLDGSVQHVGDQVRMKLSLTRTNDGAEVWSGEIGGKLDDVFAFQQRIAREVEGRIRGRVAPGGGVRAQNIATSGEVYAVYADARALMRRRDSTGGRAAIPLLRKAVAMDPNYAPAWASLGQVMGMGIGRLPEMNPGDQQELAVTYVKRALELAPNLSQAHAVLGMLSGRQPEAEAELRKGLALDPGNTEAWGWLGNFYKMVSRYPDALAAYTHAEEQEPLWIFTVGNRVLCLAQMRKLRELDAEMARLRTAGDSVLLLQAQALAAGALNHPGDKIRIFLQLRSAHPEQASWVDNRIPAELFQLGFVEEGLKGWNAPQENARDYRGDPTPRTVLNKEITKPIDFWLTDDSPAVFGRSLPKHGRLAEYVGYYRAAFPKVDDLFANVSNGRLITIAPSLVANLRAAGLGEEANTIRDRVEAMLNPALHTGPLAPEDSATLAQFRAVDGRDDDAVALLARAVAGGYLPDGRFAATDIAEEPCFARLVNRPDFQAIRRRIFARVEEERRKVPLELLAQAYPVKRQLAA